MSSPTKRRQSLRSTCGAVVQRWFVLSHERTLLGMGPSTQVPQRQLQGFAAMPAREPMKVESHWLSSCASLLDAIHLCIHLSKLPHYAIAERLGVDKGHWTRMMQGQAHFPTNKM